VPVAIEICDNKDTAYRLPKDGSRLWRIVAHDRAPGEANAIASAKAFAHSI
jgi:hypothetical protein